ncbi:MAG: glycerol-3-phosphate acyltransferase, partial [Halothiobacillus sp. 20-54-6]
WLGVAFLTRYSSLSAVVAAVVSASAALYLTQAPSMIAISVMSFILIGRHQSNIRRLLRGEETRIGQKKTPAP